MNMFEMPDYDSYIERLKRRSEREFMEYENKDDAIKREQLSLERSWSCDPAVKVKEKVAVSDDYPDKCLNMYGLTAQDVDWIKFTTHLY